MRSPFQLVLVSPRPGESLKAVKRDAQTLADLLDCQVEYLNNEGRRVVLTPRRTWE